MIPSTRSLALATVLGSSLFGATAIQADDMAKSSAAVSATAASSAAVSMEATAQPNAYVQTNLVSDGAIPARTTDPKLLNSWGVAFFPGGPFWVANNGSGFATLYDGTGAKQALEVEIPTPNGAPEGSTAAPTGMVFNPTTQFAIPGTNNLPAFFLFATEDGTIAAWNPNLADRTRAVLVVDNSQNGAGAVYKGLATGSNSRGNFLFAANFRAGTVDVFDTNFAPATLDGSFTDPDLPLGFAPFGIRNVDGDVIVTFALQDDAKQDDVAGPGNGFVDIFDTDGHLIRRFASDGQLNSPWGITRTSFAFGRSAETS